ncbi:winged helix-turn-helix transcriptional regulator [Rhizobium sp. KVB221]|uniref:Winged helix-turn-helix transcriptional regulator n=1 Tax=Rhizobium setariae TaxID=2801340 RepID=A0A936YW81_9HYPH|nr:MarR family winged helix-turn-helix transcriptional regulator [Rhizobium setariae]MBL0374430.1 winged helix-turn-helix transcriptional regulator [Rhizobium setariae]
MNEDIPSEAVIDAWINLVRAQHRVLSSVETDLKSAGFPPLAWYDVLLELRKAGDDGLRPLEIEARLLLAQHSVSRLVDRLEKAGHVERKAHETDGRGQRIRLTSEGRGLLEQMWPAYRSSINRHIGKKLRDDDAAKELAALLGRLLDG